MPRPILMVRGRHHCNDQYSERAAGMCAQADDEKRHLLRFWVDTDANTRPIAPTFAPRSSVQAEGGFKVWA